MLIESVFQFNKEVVKIEPRPLHVLPNDELKWLSGAIKEEADELEWAITLVDQVDALIDASIFALGGLYRLGLTEKQATLCFMAVMNANFEKKAGQKASRAVGDVPDAVKPEGWVGPEDRIKAILYGAPADE